MASEFHVCANGATPFILRFAQPIATHPARSLRYDEHRQIVQVIVDGHWIDSPDAGDEVFASTRITLVGSETTDDE